METVIVLSVMGILFVGCWYVGDASQKYWKQLESDPESVVLVERKWDWAIWGPFLIAIVVIAWAAPILIAYVIVAYLFYWSANCVWFKYVDWSIVRANRKNQNRPTGRQTGQAAKELSLKNHDMRQTSGRTFA